MAKAEMKKIERTDPEAKSADLVAENIARLRELFPELITEGEAGVRVNVDVLKQLVGDKTVTDAEEKYGLNWHGKRAARQLALTPSLGTLRPCPEESVDWDSTQNLMIEGDNLEVLKLLQKSYAGKVKLIYIDPPYNTGKDFVYPDNFQDNIRNYLELTGQVEGGAKISSNTEASGRFHTAWLNLMYPRIRTAHALLRGDGVIFISIDDREVSRVRMLCDEVFGEENFIANIVWQRKQSPQNDAINFSDMHDHIVVYAKQAKHVRGSQDGWNIHRVKREDSQEARYENRDSDPRGNWTSADLTCNKTASERPNLYYPIPNSVSGEDVWPSETRVWGFEKPVMLRLIEERRIWWGETGANKPRLKVFRSEVDDGVVPSTWWEREFAGDNQDAKRELRGLFDGKDVFDTPKPVSLIRRILEIGAGAGSGLVLDFFAGSGVTGHASYLYNATCNANLRFVLVQLPEPVGDAGSDLPNIAEITKERLRRAGKKVKQDNPKWKGDTGFRVFKLDSSNIKAWDPTTDDVAKDIEQAIDHLKSDRSEQDILYEMLLKLGLDLCVPMESKEIAGKQVYSIGGGVLVACLDKKIERKEAEKLALGIAEWHKKLNPAGDSTCVFRDSAFADDVAKTNLAAILNQHGITTIRSI